MRTFVFIVAVLVSATSTAEEREPLTGPRGTVEVGTWGAHTPSTFSLGLTLHLGFRPNDTLAFYVLGQGGLLMPAAQVSAVAELLLYTDGTVDLSVASGAGVLVAQPASLNAGICVNLFSSGGCGGGGGTSSPQTTVAIGAPVRVIVATGETHQLFFAVDAFLGARWQPEPGFAGTVGASLGYRTP